MTGQRPGVAVCLLQTWRCQCSSPPTAPRNSRFARFCPLVVPAKNTAEPSKRDPNPSVLSSIGTEPNRSEVGGQDKLLRSDEVMGSGKDVLFILAPPHTILARPGGLSQTIRSVKACDAARISHVRSQPSGKNAPWPFHSKFQSGIGGPAETTSST